jgi:hypothetical protein
MIEYLLSRKWQIINEELAYKKIINVTNTIELRDLGRYLYKIKCKWENRIKEFQLEVSKFIELISMAYIYIYI